MRFYPALSGWRLAFTRLTNRLKPLNFIQKPLKPAWQPRIRVQSSIPPVGLSGLEFKVYLVRALSRINPQLPQAAFRGISRHTQPVVPFQS